MNVSIPKNHTSKAEQTVLHLTYAIVMRNELVLFKTSQNRNKTNCFIPKLGNREAKQTGFVLKLGNFKAKQTF